MISKERLEKVGGDLDGVKCACCGSESLAEGQLYSIHGVFFQPVDAKWYATGPAISAHACEDCGYLSFFVDPKALTKCPRKPE